MSYIGASPIVGNFQVCDAISVVNGQAAYTLQVGGANAFPETVNNMIVSVNGVIQKPTSSYTVSGSTITFTSNLVTGDVIDFIQILGSVLDLGTPSDNTVTTAKIADGAVTAAKFASGVGGKVLQVLSTAKTNTFSSTSTSYTDITGYSVAITPSSSSSKIFIQGFLSVSVNSWNTNGSFFQLVRGSTNILTSSGSSANGSFSYAHEAGSENASKKGIAPAGFCFLDSPSSTSEITYKVQGKTTSGSNGEFYINYNGNGGTNYTTTSVITVMEVSG